MPAATQGTDRCFSSGTMCPGKWAVMSRGKAWLAVGNRCKIIGAPTSSSGKMVLARMGAGSHVPIVAVEYADATADQSWLVGCARSNISSSVQVQSPDLALPDNVCRSDWAGSFFELGAPSSLQCRIVGIPDRYLGEDNTSTPSIAIFYFQPDWAFAVCRALAAFGQRLQPKICAGQ